MRGEVDDFGIAFFIVHRMSRRKGGKQVLPARMSSDIVRRK